MKGTAGPPKAASKGLESAAIKVVYRVSLSNIAVGVIGTIVTFLAAGTEVAVGFLTGFILGVINAFWLLRIAGKGVRMPAEKAGRFVTLSYYFRFIVTALVVLLILVKGLVTPWPLVAGLSASIFTTVTVMVLVARREAS